MWKIVLNGPGYLETTYELKEGESRLGRSEDNHIVLAGENVSRRHGRLVLQGDTLVIEDTGSRNGILLNGRRIENRAVLRAGDVIEIGENRLSVFYFKEQTSLYERKMSEVPSLQRLQKAQAGKIGPELDPFHLLYRASERLAKSTDVDEFLRDVAEMVRELAGGETAAVLLPGADGQLALRALSRANPDDRTEPPISGSIARRAFLERTVICMADATQDPRFAAEKSVVRHGQRQVVCLPILRDQNAMGVFYLTRRGAGDDLERLIDALTAISYLTASGLERQLIRERAEKEAMARKTLERFLAPDVVDRVAEEAGALRMEERVAAVLFADISGFTALTERAPAERVVALLDEFYKRMTEVVFAFGGTVDKFIGDEVMAIFGAPYSYGDDASRAIRAGLAMRAAFATIRALFPFAGECGLKVGIHHGKLLAGTVGGEHRLAYTAVGDTVNVASRLVAEAGPDQIIVSEAVVEAARPLRAHVRRLGPRTLRGRQEPVEICELLGASE
ncbi:MAG: adenylate/guanylate cyclase domain-containing protein [Pseudomonadota bacterium]|nr:MAG: hypothetical protein DIU72_05030 [Pseudomonadota bacterium]